MVDHETGEVLAHVGGRDYSQAQFDFIELGKRPLGTAFFPYIYAAGLTANLTPATLVEDEPMDNRAVMVGGQEGILGEWGMEVSAPVYEGKIPAREALENSKIAATVRFAGMTGLQRVVDTSVAFGLPLQKAELLPRLAVGFEEVSMKQAVRAMSVFPLGGMAGPEALVYLDRVENAAGRIVYRRQRQPRTQQQGHRLRHRVADPQHDGRFALPGELEGRPRRLDREALQRSRQGWLHSRIHGFLVHRL